MDVPFVGIGKNPEGKDLPLGFGMQLAQESEAMEAFGRLTRAQRDSIVDYIQGCATSDDAINRITTVITGLKDGQTSFL